MTNSLPLISCLCVSHKKPELLKRAITCFQAQSYPAKELVIVYEDNDPETGSFIEKEQVAASDNIQVKMVPAVPKISLGELRNIGIQTARGEFICQWDDDDWYHVDRLYSQYRSVKETHAGSILTRWIVYNSLEKKAYVSKRRLWEGSILCSRNMLQLKPYEAKHLGEDTATIDYLNSLNYLHLIEDRPELYIYVYHGSNTWNAAHWHRIFASSTPLPESESLEITAILNGGYSNYESSGMLSSIMERVNQCNPLA
jgi:glycosyltransferase involved in cell wall biosynthesis